MSVGVPYPMAALRKLSKAQPEEGIAVVEVVGGHNEDGTHINNELEEVVIVLKSSPPQITQYQGREQNERKEGQKPLPESAFFHCVFTMTSLHSLLNPFDELRQMARPAGFEPATYGLEVRCSILAELRAHQGFQGIHHNAVCGSV